MRRWKTFNAICGYLRHGLLAAPPVPVQEIAPELLIDVSSRHLVTPALAWSTRVTHLPTDLRDYLDAVLALNERRNRTLTTALHDLVAAFNAIGIEPVLLKGAAYLMDNLYPAPGIRLVGDLDILIPADRAADALAAAESIGYEEAHYEVRAAHHLPPLRQRRTGVTLELHTAIAPAPYNAVVPTEWFFEESRAAPTTGLRARIPSSSCAAAHIVVHDQLHHTGFKRGEFNLRELLDLALIRVRYEQAIDWAAIAKRFANAGHGKALATYMAYIQLLLGQAPPDFRDARCIAPPVEMQVRRAVERRTQLRLTVAKIVRLPLGYAAARYRDPRGLLKLGKPSTWRRGLRRIQDAAKS